MLFRGASVFTWPADDDIVTTSKSIGLQVDSSDVQELAGEHLEEFSIEEFQQPQAEQQTVAAEELSEEEGNINKCSQVLKLRKFSKHGQS